MSSRKCTLDWINSNDKVLKPFIGNRVRSIRTDSSPQQWRYVPTDLNPADIGSRGSSIGDLTMSSLWLEGPSFLRLPKSSWPQPHGLGQAADEALEEVKNGCTLEDPLHVLTEQECAPPIEVTILKKFNSLRKASRTLAFVELFISKARAAVSNPPRRKPEAVRILGCSMVWPKMRTVTYKKLSKLPYLTPLQMQSAENRIIRSSHMFDDSRTYATVKDGSELRPSHALRKLNLFLDDNGIIRIKSRLSDSANLSYNIRFPIYVPRKSHLAAAIFWDHHLDNLHSTGINHTMADINSKFHVRHGREYFKSLVRSCQRCKLLWPKTRPQLMAPLPDFRVTSGTPCPFSTTTLDAAGPFQTKQRRGHQQVSRHLILFTCAITRAVHIEVMTSTDTDSFLLALTRFCSTRGRPRRIVCDNATQFRAASTALNKSLDDPSLSAALCAKYPKIEFRFIPARTPHANGITERIIQSMKRAIKHVITPGLLREDEFLTAAKLAEGILNTRPLTYVSNSPDDLRPLTPAHFLAGSTLHDANPIPLNTSLAKRYNIVHEALDRVWIRYQKEILPQLRVVNKWMNRRDNLSVGDIVIVMDDPDRGSFPLGKVTEVHPNPTDGVTRSVSVAVGQNIWRRHANSLLLLVRPEHNTTDETVIS
jgi:hypothetical protein